MTGEHEEKLDRFCAALRSQISAGDFSTADETLSHCIDRIERDASLAVPLLSLLSEQIPYVNTFRKRPLAVRLADQFPIFMAAIQAGGSGRRLKHLLSYYTLLLFLRRTDLAQQMLETLSGRLNPKTMKTLEYLTNPKVLLVHFSATEFPFERKLALPVASAEALAEPPADDCIVLLAPEGPPTAMVPPSHILDPYGTMDRTFEFELPLGVPDVHMTCLRGAATVAAGALLTHRQSILFESVYREQFPPPADDRIHRKSVVKRGGEPGMARFDYNTHGHVRVVPEPCVMLATERKFFATWMIHQLPRMFYADRIGVPGLKYVINKDINSNCFEMLEALGVPPEQIIELDPGAIHVFDTLYVPTSPAFEWEWCRPETRAVFDRLRSMVRAEPGPKAIYISRRDTTRKKAENDEEVARVLENRGFTVVVPGQLSFMDKLACFSGARVIAGAVGSGQFNALLAAPGCHLINLSNPLAVPFTTASLAPAIGGKASYVFGRFLEPMPAVVDRLTHARFASANFEVDLESLDDLAATVMTTLGN